MITDAILVFRAPGPIELLVIFIVFAIPIFLIFLAVRFISKGSKERQKLRMELGKLSEELERIRKQAKGSKRGNSAPKSE